MPYLKWGKKWKNLNGFVNILIGLIRPMLQSLVDLRDAKKLEKCSQSHWHPVGPTNHSRKEPLSNLRTHSLFQHFPRDKFREKKKTKMLGL